MHTIEFKFVIRFSQLYIFSTTVEKCCQNYGKCVHWTWIKIWDSLPIKGKVRRSTITRIGSSSRKHKETKESHLPLSCIELVK
jgi:hypothetical protein